MGEEIIVILGPTASGKTQLAVNLALDIDAEIISADSRQVYKGMDVGTGKDLREYEIGDRNVKYHLIDIISAGEKYNLSKFQSDFKKSALEIQLQRKSVVVCGGTGLYIQGIIQGFGNTLVPENKELREELESLTDLELKELLDAENLDFDTRKRAIRALEIDRFKKDNPRANLASGSEFKFKVFGLNPDVNVRRDRISKRLKERIQKQGMIQEVEELVASGLSYEMLDYYGLEYKYLGLFLRGFLRYDEMYTKLETEIHRYAKRQMTFFRSMEKKGIEIDWIEDGLSLQEKVGYVKAKTVN
jgi:tRNA dimethylallyltransferase